MYSWGDGLFVLSAHIINPISNYTNVAFTATLALFTDQPLPIDLKQFRLST